MKYRNMIALGAMALALVACGDDKDNKGKENTGGDNKPTTQAEDFSKVPENLVAKVKEKTVFALDEEITAIGADQKPKKRAKGEKVPLKMAPLPDHKEFLMGQAGDKSVTYAAFGNNFGGAVVKTVIGKDKAWESMKVVDRSFGLRSTPTELAPMVQKGVVANYAGKAFAYGGDKKHAFGDFSYKVDFGKKTGEGKITGIKSLMSKAGPIDGFDGLILKGQLGPEEVAGQQLPHSFGKATLAMARGGDAKSESKDVATAPQPKNDAKPHSMDKSFDYKLSFFGPKANEVAGAIVVDESFDVVMSGVRKNEAAKPAK